MQQYKICWDVNGPSLDWNESESDGRHRSLSRSRPRPRSNHDWDLLSNMNNFTFNCTQQEPMNVTDRQTDRQRYRQADRETDRQAGGHIDRQTQTTLQPWLRFVVKYEQLDIQLYTTGTNECNRQAEIQTGRQTSYIVHCHELKYTVNLLSLIIGSLYGHRSQARCITAEL